MTYVAGAGFDSENNTTVGNTQPGDRNAGSNVKLRGLSTPTLQRDGFMPGGGIGTGVSSTFDVERVEVINGPQSLLYGNGGAGGIIDTISKQARFDRRAFGSILLRADEYANVLVMPNPTTGLNGPLIATIDNQPRAYQISSTLSF